MKIEELRPAEFTACFTPSEADFLEMHGRQYYPEISALATKLWADFVAVNPPGPLTQLEAVIDGAQTAEALQQLTDATEVTANGATVSLAEQCIKALERRAARETVSNNAEQHVMGPARLSVLNLFEILDLAVEHADTAADRLSDAETLAQAHDVVRQNLLEQGDLPPAQIDQDLATAATLDAQFHFDQIKVANGLIAAVRPLFL